MLVSPSDVHPGYKNGGIQIDQPKLKLNDGGDELDSELNYYNIWSDGLCGCGSDVRIKLFIFKFSII